MKFTYLLVDLFTVIIPVIFSFHPKLNFYKHFTAFLKANLVTAAIFLSWDIYFTFKGIWSFNSSYTLGWKVYNLPIEEILFFICIPFACLFTFHCISLYYTIKWSQKTEKAFILICSVLLITTGILCWDKAYTATTFLSTVCLLLLLKYYFKVTWLPQLLTVYLFLLIPFTIVNGILTGTGLEAPVVAYNEAENLGIRILTIPVEDVIYGLELFLCNVFLFEKFKGHSHFHRIQAGTPQQLLK